MLTRLFQIAVVLSLLTLFTPTSKAQLSDRQMINECIDHQTKDLGNANWSATMNCTFNVYTGEALDWVGNMTAEEAQKLWAWMTGQPGYTFDIRTYDLDGMDDYGW